MLDQALMYSVWSEIFAKYDVNVSTEVCIYYYYELSIACFGATEET